MGGSGSKATSTALKNVTLWKSDRSPACRAVMMALDALDLSINEVDVNMDRGEHRTPEMLMRNPHQTLPVFQDKELIIRDSHAICTYLAGRYNDSGRLLPKDPGGRAVMEQQMHYNGGILYPRYRAAVDPILYENCTFVMPQQVCEIECAYADLECMLAGKPWFGGSWPTLADLCIGATASTLHCLVPVDRMRVNTNYQCEAMQVLPKTGKRMNPPRACGGFIIHSVGHIHKRYPRLSGWLFRMSEQVFYITANKKGLCEFVRRIGELTQIQKS